MNTLKYILIHIELFLMICSIIFGIGCAESSDWWMAVLFLFGPFVWGKLTNLGKRIDWCEVYERASRIASIKSSK